MPHGDMSDIAALAMIGGGVQQVFFPAMSFSAIGPLQPMFAATSPALEQMVRVTGSSRDGVR